MSKTKKMEEELYVARDENGSLYLFAGKPIKKEKEWIGSCVDIENNLFPEVLWQDNEPLKITR